MRARDRIIVAIDKDPKLLEPLLREIKDEVGMFKLGLTVLTMYSARELVEWFRGVLGIDPERLMFDPKGHDIPEQVAGAAEVYRDLGAGLLTIHASGGPAMMRKAVKTVRSQPSPLRMLGITVLTSISPRRCRKTYGAGTERKVLQLARSAYNAGMDGVVCSALEVGMLQQDKIAKRLLKVVPGIRLPNSDHHDQKRVGSPYRARKDGADFLVVGRDITGAANPLANIARIEAYIEQADEDNAAEAA